MTELATAGYEKRRSWSDGYMPVVIDVLQRRFNDTFKEAKFSDDAGRGIDLQGINNTISLRVRQSKYSNFNDFTLRTSHTGYKSDYSKLLLPTRPGFLFYGYAIEDKITAGYTINLYLWHCALRLGRIKPMFRRNKDGSHFVAFPLHPDYTERLI